MNDDLPFLLTFDGSAFALTVFTAFMLLVGLYQSTVSLIRSQKTEQAELYFEIATRWTATLKVLYQVRNNPPPTTAQLEAQYGSCADFMSTAEWRETYRPICNFFEDLGLLVYNKNIPIEIIRVLVTVSPNDYLLMKPVLDYVRGNYRHDIYSFWNYLLEQAEKTKPLRPYKGKLYEPS